MDKRNAALLSLLTLSLCSSGVVHADARPQAEARAISVYLDGQRLQSGVQPLNLNGTVLVPMRGLFEAQGAKLSWNNADKTVTAIKADTTLTYRLGARTAELNGQTLSLAVPGQIAENTAMIPLRFVSEALGNKVDWVPGTQSVQISSGIIYETSILYGVNLRSLPDAKSDPVSPELLPAGTKVHVVSVVDALWLKVKTGDNQTGYISAKPKYTDYTSGSLADKQAEALIAYGKTFLGTPYEFGASPDQTATFDCSSFVKRVFEDTLSIKLPRVSYDQAKEGKEVGLDGLRPGDLLFFSARGLDIGHVAIYAGNNQLLHTYSTKLNVHVEAFDGQWKKRFVTARRIL
ncbi:stalk domain-containing protein [Paenibacillus jilunlii]|uniref:Cell wall-associated hydrolase, NlpC family n=1 Tax=Paenibacillus jilunlii TaxID=682956 RepID=A0A1G9TN89_9BACL|nr:stalk domain-containing protein [Paenibacillus jilunlii]KWX71934.1 copper amine oxidase [Paenibacillus jilunlii]SDM49153.1 Cell wall-associated hydrolase, NlpC family [Paenibacillus jilunlii]